MGKSEKSSVIGIFVGLGDHADQTSLAKRRARQGWAVGTWDGDEVIKQKLATATPDDTVYLNGASANDCVPRVIRHALEQNVKQVVVPLRFIRGGEQWDPRNPIRQRAKVMVQALVGLGVDVTDPSIVVYPKTMWEYAKSTWGKKDI